MDLTRSQVELPELVPVLPIRQTVVFPNAAVPLVVTQAKSVQAVRKAQAAGNLILVVAQKENTADDASPDQFHSLGVVCRISKVNYFEDDSCQLIAHGLFRYQVRHFFETSGYIAAQGKRLQDRLSGDATLLSHRTEQIKEMGKNLLALASVPGADALAKLFSQVQDPSQAADLCCTFLQIDVARKQQLLELVDVQERLEILFEILQTEKTRLSVQTEIHTKVLEKISREQRDHVLREQLKTIQAELGERPAQESYSGKIDNPQIPENVRKVLAEETARLTHVHRASPEYHVIRSYVDLVLSLPWGKESATPFTLDAARAVLDADHYGIDKVKRRIVQFLAVTQLKSDIRGPILCLTGPPGVGKTSLAKSIAKALGRQYARVSLGGVRDEAEIRGHRRTYIGAMPGKIIQAIKRTQVNDPVILLDEIDKMGTDFRGDPSAALLEVLDPEQNGEFVDHYLDIPFDLSKVFFIATSNSMDPIPAALRDRLEVLEMTSYSKQEKVFIATQHLLPKLLTEHGLQSEEFYLAESALDALIDDYTREAGVRQLNREMAALLRAAAEEIVRNRARDTKGFGFRSGHAPQSRVLVTLDRLAPVLGPKRYFIHTSDVKRQPGIVTGLAWTPVGGEILHVESREIPGTGELKLTGQLGEVMKESAQIALTLLRSNACAETLAALSGKSFHIHVPSGSVQKDGPSAGIAIYLSMVGLATGKSVDPLMAFTGEITLRGTVLPVGGIKEKVLAAHRSGIECVVLPRRNEGELTEIPEEIRKQIRFHFVHTVEDVLRLVGWADPLVMEATEQTQLSPTLRRPEWDNNPVGYQSELSLF
jgi:ATP-dependent Lon protease